MKRILVAYDGGEPARRALDTAIELTRPTTRRSLSSASYPSTPIGRQSDPWDDGPVHDQQLAEAREILAREGIVAELIEPLGEPARTIERVAEEGHFDTIVVGSRGLNAMSRFLQGSVSEHVATHASATVVIAR